MLIVYIQHVVLAMILYGHVNILGISNLETSFNIVTLDQAYRA